jgi:3-deoxy-D-manno-octulosonate 8-phosphate phosphatase (KDO 8-P phosphatase)
MNISDSFKKITTFIFDVDGVLTDGTILLLENGLQARRMSIRDGYAMQLAVKKGYRIAIVSGGAPSPVVDRLEKLGITDVFMSVTDKKARVDEYLQKKNIQSAQVLFMGDDIPDLEVMQAVGMAACPADAAPEILAIAAYISPYAGGSGCARDVIEKVLQQNNDWLHQAEVVSA